MDEIEHNLARIRRALFTDPAGHVQEPAGHFSASSPLIIRSTPVGSALVSAVPSAEIAQISHYLEARQVLGIGQTASETEPVKLDAAVVEGNPADETIVVGRSRSAAIKAAREGPESEREKADTGEHFDCAAGKAHGIARITGGAESQVIRPSRWVRFRKFLGLK